MMGLRARFIVLALFAGFVVWPLYWATNKSPQAQQARARAATLTGAPGCITKPGVVKIKVSVSKYPDNWRHIVDARAGRNTGPDGKTIADNGLKWPRILEKNDVGEDGRRDAGIRMSGLPSRAPGWARDEYPPAEGRSTNAADFRYVPFRQNSAQGASMGGQLRRYCNRQRYELVSAP